MDTRKNNKSVIIISSILILLSLILAIIYRLSSDNKTIDRDEYFHNYKVNEVQNIYVSLREVANKYLADLVSEIVYYPEDVYNKLDNKSKEVYSTYNIFKEKVDTLKTISFLEASVVSYSEGVIDGKRSIYVIDKAGNKFIFIENGINDYKIRIG